MRLTTKYQIFNKVNILPTFIPLRILKFKRPKWKRLQKTVINLVQKKKKNFNINKKVLNPILIKKTYKNWTKIKTKYKESLLLKRSVYSLFDFNVNKKSLFTFNSNESKNTFLCFFMKLEFKIENLLWRLNFLNSCYSIKQLLNTGLILINFKKTKNNCILKKGDIITFSNNCLLYYKKENTLLFNKKIFSFLEIDYYSNTIVMLKNYNEITIEESTLFFSKFYNIKLLKDFFKK
jgi:ribosomal protein S4